MITEDNNLVNEIIDTINVDKTVISQITEFHNQLYGDEKSVKDWEWQYSLYEPLHAIFTVLKNEDVIVATQAMMPIYIKIGFQTLLTGKSEDTLLHPEYRKKNLMAPFYEYNIKLCKQNNFPFAYYVWQSRFPEIYFFFPIEDYNMPQEINSKFWELLAKEEPGFCTK